MPNLINNAMSGLNAAEAALNTISNNISNSSTKGYSRQNVSLAQNGTTLTGGSYYGNGVKVTGVHREYDQLITDQLRTASSQFSGLTARYSQLSNIDNMLSNTSNTLSSNIQEFFGSLQTLVSNASDSSVRQAVLGKAAGLVNQFQVTNTYLSNIDNNLNASIKSSVDQINNYATQIANLNQQINKLSGAGAGSEPNDLLDRRDQLVKELNDVIGVNVSQQDGGSYNISIRNGISLVQGSSASKLAAVPSSSDPSRTTIATIDARTGAISEIPEKLITSGSLSGLFVFRSDLDAVRNQINQLALTLGDSFNTQHKAGVDSNGNPGEDFFNLGQPSVISNTNNTTTTSLSAEWTNTRQVQASDYKLTYDGSNWSVTRLADNAKLTATPGTDGNGNATLSFDGLQVTVDGAPAAKDSFIVKPVANVITGMSVNITNEAQLAAASQNNGQSNNENAQALLDLQNQNLVNGNSTLNEAYASLVADVGNKTSSLKSTSITQENVVNQLSKQQQSISGVNLDEEYGNLVRSQQFFIANTKSFEAASITFNALIAAVS